LIFYLIFNIFIQTIRFIRPLFPIRYAPSFEIDSLAFAEPALMEMGGQAYFVPRNRTVSQLHLLSNLKD
jgi:hypothetical protein